MVQELKQNYMKNSNNSATISDFDYFLSVFAGNSKISSADIYADIDAINLFRILNNENVLLSEGMDYYFLVYKIIWEKV